MLSTRRWPCDQTPVQGEPVVAFGHPAGQDFTASTGIISGQRFELSAQAEFIQTDAAINPGNSGGPLISVKTNQIIGINTYGIEAEGLNFALPLSTSVKLLTYLKRELTPHQQSYLLFLLPIPTATFI